MKQQVCALLCAALLAMGAGALAQTATYVFPYEGFRYTQREDETVLTQTNLSEHEELLKSLGTSSEAVLASYVASGIVMEVIPNDGGQIAVSVTDAGKFGDVKDMDELTQEQRLSFLAQFEMSGLYETCAYVDTTPACVRLTSSAMYASMPVYSLRYATLHLGRLYMIEQTIVGREPDADDDARMERLLEGVKLLSSVSEATPTPQATATPQPTATPEPVVGEAEVETSGALKLDSGIHGFGAAHPFRRSGALRGNPGGSEREADRQNEHEKGRKFLRQGEIAGRGRRRGRCDRGRGYRAVHHSL